MNRTILYYPTINIPSNHWLRNSLLYWDEVSSIVPRSFEEETELSADIEYLIDEGQFRPIKPEKLIDNPENRESFFEFERELMQIFISDGFQIFLNYRNRNRPLQFSRIHRNKTSDYIFNILEERGLATRPNNYEWLYFERNTAFLYMSILAKYLADVDSNQTTIGTDYLTYEKFNFKKVNQDEGFPVVNFNLNNVLPTPVNNVPFEKIIKFKKERKDNLNHFKKTLSDFQMKISKCTSQSELKESTVNFQENLINCVNDLSKTLKDSKIDSRFKSLKSVINLKSPTTLLSLGAGINSKIDLINLPVDLTTIIIGAVGAIELTSNYIDNRNKERAKLRESPFSYVYYAQKSGIIHRI